MGDNTKSNLRLYSLGLVANNKEVDAKIINVVPIEQTPFLDGELVSMPFESEQAGSEGDDAEFNVKVTSDVAVTATWLSLNSNRATPPDVRRGMRVLLWKFADQNDFFWTYAGLDDHLFKLETVIFRISATSDEDADSLAPENCYSLEMCSRTGKITLQTSKANGEFCVYAFQFNMKDGKAVLCDELGNSFMLDSANTILELENADGTRLALDKEIIEAFANDRMDVETGKSVNIKTKTVNVKAESLNVNTQKNTFTTPETEFTGNVTIGGNLNQKGSGNFEGAANFTKPITAAGITSSATIRGPSGSI